MNFYQALAVPVALLLLILALPALADQPPPSCSQQVAQIEEALVAEGPRRAVFEEHMELLRESRRRGEETLCRDIADDLRERLRAAAV